MTPVLRLAAIAAALTLAGAPALAAGPLKAADYAAILAAPARSDADRKDDAARKPAEVLAFAQVRPGDTVMEIEVGRGLVHRHPVAGRRFQRQGHHPEPGGVRLFRASVGHPPRRRAPDQCHGNHQPL